MALAASFRRGASRILAVKEQPHLAFYSGHGDAPPAKIVHPPPPQYWPPLFLSFVAAYAAYGDDRASAHCSRTAAKRRGAAKATRSGSKGGRRSPHDADTHELDLCDPANQAFDLVINHGFKIQTALDYTKNPTSYNALWKRKRNRDRLQTEQGFDELEEEAFNTMANHFTLKSSAGEGGGLLLPLQQRLLPLQWDTMGRITLLLLLI